MEKNAVKKLKKVVVPNTEVSLAQSTSTRKYLTIVGAICAVVIIAGGYTGYRLASSYAKQSNQNKAQDQLVASLETKQKNLKELKPNYDAITNAPAGGRADSILILNALPITQDYENLIAVLEKIGKDSGVKLSTVSQSGAVAATAPVAAEPGAVEVATGPSPFGFTVNIEGTYNAVLDFLKKTENSSRVINFNSMTLGGTSPAITASLTMTTYFQTSANISSTEVPLK